MPFVFNLQERKDQIYKDPEFSLLLKPRSLLVLKDLVYTDYLHCIQEIYEDNLNENIVNLEETGQAVGDCLAREVRVSLTIRFVPKTLKVKLMLGNR